jgi:hypothetical protein
MAGIVHADAHARTFTFMLRRLAVLIHYAYAV